MLQISNFSECGKYRYKLTRVWDEIKPIALCIGLNPSKAGKLKKDGTEYDDPTIRRLIDVLGELGFGGLYMMNLYALVSPKPSKLFEVPDNLGSNDQWLITSAYGAQEIIFCWGAFKRIEHRVKKVREMFPSAKCFGKNKDGSPWHPLALMYGGVKSSDVKLIKF